MEPNGLRVGGHVCNLLMLHAKMEFKEANRIAHIFDERVKEMDWLETYDGTTFTKTFTPKEPEHGESDTAAVCDRPRTPDCVGCSAAIG